MKNSKQKCKELLLKLHNDNIVITHSTMQKMFHETGISIKDILNNFGTLTQAKKELNIPITQNRTTLEEAIEKIHFLNKKYGYFSKSLLESLNIRDEPMIINPKTIVRFWGNFNNMYEELGIKRSEAGIVKTEKQLIDSIIQIYKEYGYISSYLLVEEGPYSYDPYILRWGSFENACKAANVPYSPYTRWIAEEATIIHASVLLNEEPEREKTFDWLYNFENTRPLRVDAYFKDANLIIEYNGKQHYNFVNHFHENLDTFKKSQKRDNHKYKKIKENGINLIIHKYSDNIELLTNKVNNIKLSPFGLYHDLLE